MDLIRMSHVKKTYKNGVTAIYDLNLKIKKGDFVFIIGSTGCGKSTLIKMLYREEKPNSGTILIGGLNVGRLRNNKVYKLRRKLGVVFQDFKLLYMDVFKVKTLARKLNLEAKLMRQQKSFRENTKA